MKIETGQCAQCGHKLDPGFENDSCNTAFDHITKIGSPYRPYFCSDDCVDQAITNGVNAELDEQSDYLEKSIRDTGDEAFITGDRSAYNRYVDEKRQFRINRPERFQDELKSATTKYFSQYFDERSKSDSEFWSKEVEKSEKNLAKAEQAYAKEMARELAVAEKEANREAAAAQKQTEREAATAEKEAKREAAIAQRQVEREEAVARKQAEREAAEALNAEQEAERLRPIPLEIPPDHSRYEGVHVLGPSGSGKTTLAQAFLIHDIMRDDPPSLIVLDPKGLLIARLKAFEALDPSKVVIIDASHPHPAKLGLFVKSQNPAVNAEQIVNQAISTYRYIFEASNFSFTEKQGILLENVVRLMFETGGTLSSLIDFLRRFGQKRPPDFAAMFPHVSTELQEFFKYDFPDSYESTAREINVRLQKIKQKPILRAMFDTTERHVDFFDCIQKGKIVLVNSGMSLDPDTSRMIGRFVIAMALNAVYVRATMPESEWRPTFLIVDEFQEFVDSEKTPELLRFPREYNFGTMVLHHNMYATEIDEAVRGAISTHTGVKFCADQRGMDLNYMARDFDCDPGFLRNQQVSPTHVHFAHVMRRKYSTPVSVQIPRGNLDMYPRRTREQVEALDDANAARVHFGPTIRMVSEDEWIDHAQSGYIDDDGHSLNLFWNYILKIDPNMQRWHIGGPSSEEPTPPPPDSDPPDDPDHF